MANSRTRGRARPRSRSAVDAACPSPTASREAKPGKPVSGLDLGRFIPWLATSMTRYLHGVMTEALAPLRISIAEWRAMLCVFDGGSYTLTDVVGFTNLNQSSLSRAIVRMEKKGLVTRSRRSHDARLMSIEITQAGRTLCERASLMVREACDEELAVLTKAERDIFVRIAQKLLAELPPPKRPAGLSY